MVRIIWNKTFFYSCCLLMFMAFTNNVEAQWLSSGSNIYFSSGYVGIGTSTIPSRLTINTYGWSNSLELNNGNGYNYRINAATDGLLFRVYGNNPPSASFSFRSGSDARLFEIFTDGHVNIGTPPAGGSYKLNIGGNVRANEVVVNTSGADFVFDKSYDLLPLSELEKYVNDNKHLPEIPAAEEMQQNGLGVGEAQTKLLQKIEELTLYVIQLNNENEMLKIRVKALEK